MARRRATPAGLLSVMGEVAARVASEAVIAMREKCISRVGVWVRKGFLFG